MFSKGQPSYSCVIRQQLVAVPAHLRKDPRPTFLTREILGDGLENLKCTCTIKYISPKKKKQK